MSLRVILLGLAVSCALTSYASADVVIMGDNSDGYSTDGSYSKGNIVTVDTPVECQGIGLYLVNVPANTNLLWAVYESNALGGPFNKVQEVILCQSLVDENTRGRYCNQVLQSCIRLPES